MGKDNAKVTRQKLSFDLDEDEDGVLEPSPEEIKAKAKKISKKSGFTATSSQKVVNENAQEKAPVVPIRRARARTGRTHAFNTRIKPETYNDICMLADQATIDEDRPVSLAEIIERGIEALKTK